VDTAPSSLQMLLSGSQEENPLCPSPLGPLGGSQAPGGHVCDKPQTSSADQEREKLSPLLSGFQHKAIVWLETQANALREDF
jgi:hypothetical protein